MAIKIGQSPTYAGRIIRYLLCWTIALAEFTFSDYNLGIFLGIFVMGFVTGIICADTINEITLYRRLR